MIVVRNVFQAKYGKGSALVALFKEAQQAWPDISVRRIMTDASGPFFTVVTESELESFSAWEESRTELFSRPGFAEWFARMEPLVDSGVESSITLSKGIWLLFMKEFK